MEGDAPDVAPLDKGGLASHIRNEIFDEGSTVSQQQVCATFACPSGPRTRLMHVRTATANASPAAAVMRGFTSRLSARYAAPLHHSFGVDVAT